MNTAPSLTLDDRPFLSGIWYFGLLSREVKAGALTRQIFFGEPLVFGRMKDGTIFCHVDICPHRGAPLSAGKLCEDGTVECPYHAWRFSAVDGTCVDVPALPDATIQNIGGIGLRRYHIHEASGIVWIYFGDGVPKISPPALGIDPAMQPKTKTCLERACNFDEAVIGLVDPAHTPTVHQQWWWRKGAARKLKTKTFEPTEYGFRMPPHAPSSNSRIYKMLGGAPTTEIEFRLPGIRFEWIRNEKRKILGLTSITPTEENCVRINHLIFWDSVLFDLIKPIAQRMADDFFGQDGAILAEQHKNLSRAHHRPLYLGDPDVPAQWYAKLKRAWIEAEQGEFKNPLEVATLRWRT